MKTVLGKCSNSSASGQKIRETRKGFMTARKKSRRWKVNES